MKLGLPKLRLVLLATTLSLRTFGGVNVNNGNFYVTYTDFIVFTPGIPIEVTRTYSSRSNFVAGRFGVGWSSELDSYLKFDKKDLVYYEAGGGNILRFTAKSDTIWENGQLGNQQIKKIKSAKTFLYSYLSNNGKNYTFNSLGQLIKSSDGNKNSVEYDWEKGLISKIRDNFNNQVTFEWVEAGAFQRIKSVKYGDKKASYDYNLKNGDLLKVVSQDGTEYKYTYDDEHNMTKIAYGNGATKTMEYNKIRDWIVAFKDVDSSTIKYDYFSDSLDSENKFGTVVSRKDSTGKEDKARFWYEFRKRKDNTRYAYRTVAAYNEEATETLLTECCGTPITITQWAVGKTTGLQGAKDLSWTQPSGKRSVTRFEYYADGTLKKKSLPNGTSIGLVYDPKTKKIATLDRAGSKVDYIYDMRENLASAKDYGEKVKMDFTYDIQGRITIVKESPLTAKSNQVRSLYFKYNTEGLPVEVKEKNYDGKVALIKMVYFPNGQIKEVLNASGRTLASQSEITATQRIYGTFQKVLEVIQPSGVSLNAEGTI